MDTYEHIELKLVERMRGLLDPAGVEVPVWLEEPHTAVLDTLQYPSFVIALESDDPDMERMHSEDPYTAGIASEDDRGRPTALFVEEEPQPYEFVYRIHAFSDKAAEIRAMAYWVERRLPFRGALEIMEGVFVDCFRESRVDGSEGTDGPRYHYLWRFAVKARMHYPESRTTLPTRLMTVVELGTPRFRSSSSGFVPVDSSGNPVDGPDAVLDTLDVFLVEHDLPPD